jgi:AGZA family xanthine/uracil permease-like MFS transporter
MVDLFDTLGTLHGLGVQSKLIQEDGKVLNFKKVLFADCIGAVVGAIFGTSSVTTYVESGTGVSLGAKTGFTSVVVGGLFTLSIFVSPLFSIIPGCATAPALIFVGVLMMQTVVHIKFDSILDAIPIFFTIAFMPLTYSITNGVGLGILSYSFLHLIVFLWEGTLYLFGRKKQKPSWPIRLPCGIIAILFLIGMFLLYLLLLLYIVYFVPTKFKN